MASEVHTAAGPVLKQSGPIASLFRLIRWLWPGWLTGPIFDKELRVSSRRRRNYILRFVYLALLTLFIVLVWLSAMPHSGYGSGSASISRMSEAGKTIVAAIVWFQFSATQILAVVMLSTSISDEIYHRTLGVLMTTPINSFQIVMGKLFSKLWQLLLLLAISLPLLAIIRVLGGVPWAYLISSLCITITAVIFAASLSMLFSIRKRRAYAVILKTLFVGAFLYAFIPFIAAASIFRIGPRSSYVSVLSVVLQANPMAALVFTTERMWSPVRGGPFIFWPLHCTIMLGASALVLARAVSVVRTAALRQAVGQTDLFTRRKQRRTARKSALGQTVKEATARPIRPVVGRPVLWKELKTPILRGGRPKAMIGIAFTLLCLILTYVLCFDVLDESFVHVMYALIFLLIGMICTAVLSATSITTEKESRSWPILLATPLSDWDIIIGKAIGTFRRCLPIWLLLTGHLLLFVLLGFIHPVVLFHVGMLVFWIVVFFTGSGLYFSARFKRTTTAVVMNLALGLILWLGIPLLTALVCEIGPYYDYDSVEMTLLPNPVVQAAVVVEGAGDISYADWTLAELDYDWPDNDFDSLRQTSEIMTANVIGYSLVGLLLLCLARARLRKNIF